MGKGRSEFRLGFGLGLGSKFRFGFGKGRGLGARFGSGFLPVNGSIVALSVDLVGEEVDG